MFEEQLIPWVRFGLDYEIIHSINDAEGDIGISRGVVKDIYGDIFYKSK